MAALSHGAVRAFERFDEVVAHYPYHEHQGTQDACPGSTHLRPQDVSELILDGVVLSDGMIVDVHGNDQKIGRVLDHISRFNEPRQLERLAIFDVRDTGPALSRNSRVYDLLWGIETRRGGLSLRYNRIAAGLGVKMLGSLTIPVDLQTVQIFGPKN